ncbi:hypothetical protein BWD12_20200 [Leptospira santarosai serovar Bananal]|nr:hypothetical protein BWD11_04390 [Leptospira santarosai serovar Grippotyphosa]ONF75746.1 hypothetical protein BWD12_20200 [Leptospira santarosai serovar Bananal]
MIQYIRDQFNTKNEFIESLYNQNKYDRLDTFLKSPKASDLEKALFLLLNLYPEYGGRSYFIIPHEKVLIPNICDHKEIAINYEIDFAVYGGTVTSPTKIAIECDGIRSHGNRRIKRDRRKEVNLQAEGWLLIRIGSHEIHAELQRMIEENKFISEIAESIELIIERKLNLLEGDKYERYKKELTGYKWGVAECPYCNKRQQVKLNFIKQKCYECGSEYERDRSEDDESSHEWKGIVYFSNNFRW